MHSHLHRSAWLAVFFIPLLLCAHAHAVEYADHRPIAFMELLNCKQEIESQIKGRLPTAAEYRFGYLLYAARCLPILRNVNAQGMIIWDESIEPDAQHYLGDPRIQDPTFAPNAKMFYQIFEQAGFQTGVCLRPGILIARADGTYDRLKAETIAEDLGTKADFARKNWGCSLFYVDSNLDQEIGGAINPAWLDVLRIWGWDLSKNLFICEYTAPGANPNPFWAEADHYARSSRYIQSERTDANGKLIPIDPVPCAGAYSNTFACYSPLTHVDRSRHDELVAAVKAGNILMFLGWYDNGTCDWIKQIYHDAGVKGF